MAQVVLGNDVAGRPGRADPPDQSGRPAMGWRAVDGLVALRRRLHVRRTAAVPYLQVAPAVLLGAVLAYGLGYMVYVSFHAYDSFLAEQGPFSTSEYARLFSSANTSYLQTLVRTLVVSVIVTAVSALLAVPTAHVIVRMRSRFLRSLAIFLLLVPFLMGESIRAFAWLLILGTNGAVPWIVHGVSGHSPSLLGSTWSITLGLLQTEVPLAVLVLIPGMRKIPPDLELAAQTLGARPPAVWRRIILPLVRPSLGAACVLVFALCMTEFAVPSALGLGATPFVANSVQSIFFSEGNIYFGAAFSVVLILVVVAAVGLILLGFRTRRPRPRPPKRAAATATATTAVTAATTTTAVTATAAAVGPAEGTA